jgi:hypothetical protein
MWLETLEYPYYFDMGDEGTYKLFLMTKFWKKQKKQNQVRSLIRGVDLCEF